MLLRWKHTSDTCDGRCIELLLVGSHSKATYSVIYAALRRANKSDGGTDGHIRSYAAARASSAAAMQKPRSETVACRGVAQHGIALHSAH